MNRLRFVSVVHHSETVARETVPFGRGITPRVHNLEVNRYVTGQGLRITFRVDEEAAVVATDFEVFAPEGTGFDPGEIGNGPSADGGVVPAALDRDGLLAACGVAGEGGVPLGRRRDRDRGGRGGGGGGGGGEADGGVGVVRWG